MSLPVTTTQRPPSGHLTGATRTCSGRLDRQWFRESVLGIDVLSGKLPARTVARFCSERPTARAEAASRRSVRSPGRSRAPTIRRQRRIRLASRWTTARLRAGDADVSSVLSAGQRFGRSGRSSSVRTSRRGRARKRCSCRRTASPRTASARRSLRVSRPTRGAGSSTGAYRQFEQRGSVEQRLPSTSLTISPERSADRRDRQRLRRDARPLVRPTETADAEKLTGVGDGGLYVAYSGAARVLRITRAHDPETPMQYPRLQLDRV